MRHYNRLCAAGAILALFFLTTCGLEDSGDMEQFTSSYDGSEAKSCFVFQSKEEFPVDAPGPSEFQVNTYTSSEQYYPDIAADADGNFVVVWTSEGQDGSGAGIYGQRYNSVGAPQGSEFQVNFTVDQSQAQPSVAMDADGDFVVAWQSEGSDSSGKGIVAQRLNALGVRQAAEIFVNTTTASDQEKPEAAMDSAGNFVVVWVSENQDGELGGIFGQRFDASGAAQGVEFQINTTTTGDQDYPDVAMNADGNFVVAWGSDGADGSGYGIVAQRYNSAGVAQGTEIDINTETGGWQIGPSIDVDSSGNFGIAWQSFGVDEDGWGVAARLFDSSGSPLIDEFVVNTYTTSTQDNPDLAMSAGGSFVVSWQSQDQDGDADGIFGQEYNVSGAPVGTEFAVNTYTADDQRFPAAFMISGGNYVIVWHSFGQDESGNAIMGRLYGIGCENNGDCDDGNVCTDNTCDPDGHCQVDFNSVACDDLLFCNGGDTCDDGGCSIHVGDPCSAELFCNEADDTCDPVAPDEPVITFMSPDCITMGEQSRFDILVEYFVPDDQALIQAQFQLGWDWTLVQIYDPPILSIPGTWDISTPSSDIIDWVFESDAGSGGGVMSGESLTFSLEALLGNDVDDTEVTFWLYGDESGAEPYEWGPFVNNFEWCPTTTTTTTTTTTGTPTTTTTTVSPTTTTVSPTTTTTTTPTTTTTVSPTTTTTTTSSTTVTSLTTTTTTTSTTSCSIPTTTTTVTVPTTTTTTVPEEVLVTFTSPECIESGEISRFDVEVYFWVPDDQAIIQAQFLLGYDWTLVEVFTPPVLSVPGQWTITTPSADVINWSFIADNPEDFGGVVSGETITFSLDAIVGNEIGDDTAYFAFYGDENGAPPFEWGAFEQTFEWCTSTTTTTVTTTTSTTTTTDEVDDDTDDDVDDDTDDDVDDDTDDDVDDDTDDDTDDDDDSADDDFDDDFVDDDTNDDDTDDDTGDIFADDDAGDDDDSDNNGCGASCGC